MKFKTKKMAYLLNDLTNILLKKDKDEKEEHLKKIVIFIFILLFISLTVNFILLYKIL